MMLYFFASSQCGRASAGSSGIGPPVSSTTLSAADVPWGTAAQGMLGMFRSSVSISACHAGLGLLGVFLAALLHGLAYRGGHAVELRGGIVVFKLKPAAKLVECKHACYGLFALETFHRQTLDNELRIGFDLLYCKHLL